MNYLQMVNSVLRRLREQEVTTVYETPYSRLVSEFINDIKQQVEDAYEWNALVTTLTADTEADLFSYVLVGSGDRFRVMDVINDTSNVYMCNASATQMNGWFLNGSPQTGSPMFYSFNGVDDNGDNLVDIYPIPNGEYNLRFNVFIPQADLENDTDSPKVPYRPVVLGAYARALAERGEDSGLSSGEAFSLYKHALSDAIALEDARYIENECWRAV